MFATRPAILPRDDVLTGQVTMTEAGHRGLRVTGNPAALRRLQPHGAFAGAAPPDVGQHTAQAAGG